MIEKREISLPLGEIQKKITVGQNLIIIGANGSGKTRLGAWIEMGSNNIKNVHRISAQKSLSMPDSSSPMPLEIAEIALLYGHSNAKDGNVALWKKSQRWGHNPEVFMLSDFDKLMVYLFSEDFEQSTKYRQESKLSATKVMPPMTKLDIVKRIWEGILPHRTLTIGGGSIKTTVEGSNNSYNASEMSDGERVIFYQIGQCLAAPKNGIIIIDEPELHLHKSIQVPLWNELEKCRSDCLFVYITHDVDFSAAKESSVKIWLKSFNGTQWDWEIIEQIEGMPEELLLEVMGSRKPVVFVEGENGGFDVALYRALLRNFLVIPVGSCSRVILSVKALRANQQLHHLDIYGLIDRDRRVDKELSTLESAGIFALSVAEVENLFCTPEMLEVLAKKLEKDPTEVVEKAKNLVFKKLALELENQISLRCASEVKFKLSHFDDSAKGINGLQSALAALVAAIDIKTYYSETEATLNEAIKNKDYKMALRLYNRKSLASQIGTILGLKSNELQDYAVRLAKGTATAEVIDALKPYFGNFAKHMT